jgi:uncharacterized protein YegJ (DUF2314 family)
VGSFSGPGEMKYICGKMMHTGMMNRGFTVYVKGPVRKFEICRFLWLTDNSFSNLVM